MPNIDGLIGFNSPSGINTLLAAFGGDVIDVNSGMGYGLNLTPDQKVEFEVFLDTVFLTNGVDKMRSFYKGIWSDSISLPKGLIPKYIKRSVNNAQMLMANVILIPGTGTALNYRSYIFISDFPKIGKSPTGNAIAQTIQWGIESGRCRIDPLTSQVHAVPDDAGRLPYFKTRGIKVGDPFFLLGGDIGQYTVASVDDESTLTLNEKIGAGNTDLDFWVGSNWVSIGTDENDQIMGMGDNNSRDLIFKLFSLWTYTSNSLKQVMGAPGTSSRRSIINDTRGNTYYFHGSEIGLTGIYRYDGVNGLKASRAIDVFIQGMDPEMYSEVVAWSEGDEVRFFIGDIENKNEGISIQNAVATLNTATGAWDVGPIADVVKVATTYIDSSVKTAYTGSDDSEVMKMHSGYSHNGVSIPCAVETGVKYPLGSEVQCMFPFVQAVARNGVGISVLYKLWDGPTIVSDRWKPLGELEADLAEWEPDLNAQAAGIQFRIAEDSMNENTWVFEKIAYFYKPVTAREIEE